MSAVNLAHILIDAGTQIRAAINEQVIAEYAERMTRVSRICAVVRVSCCGRPKRSGCALAIKRNSVSRQRWWTSTTRGARRWRRIVSRPGGKKTSRRSGREWSA